MKKWSEEELLKNHKELIELVEKSNGGHVCGKLLIEIGKMLLGKRVKE